MKWKSRGAGAGWNADHPSGFKAEIRPTGRFNEQRIYIRDQSGAIVQKWTMYGSHVERKAAVERMVATLITKGTA